MPQIVLVSDNISTINEVEKIVSIGSYAVKILQTEEDIENGKSGTLPKHLKNTYSFDPSQKAYLYPHDYPNSWVDQQYLPDSLVGSKYYIPKPTSKSEVSLYNRYMQIEEFKKNKN